MSREQTAWLVGADNFALNVNFPDCNAMAVFQARESAEDYLRWVEIRHNARFTIRPISIEELDEPTSAHAYKRSDVVPRAATAKEGEG